MTRLERLLIGLIVVALALGGSYWKGWLDGTDSERVKAERKLAEAKEEAGRERERLRAVSDKLATEVRDAEGQIDAMARKLSGVLTERTSSARRCFRGPDVAGMLNGVSAAGGKTTEAGAGTASSPGAVAADPGGHPADDGSGTSERAAVTALLEARSEYAKCSVQLNGLIDWIEGATQ